MLAGLALLMAACGAPEPRVDSRRADVPRTERPSEPEPKISEPEPDPTQEVARPRAPQPLVIGLLLPLSGADADAGQALLNAAMLAYFEAYDPRLTLVPFDTQSTPEGAVDAFAKARARGVAAIVGPLRGQSLSALPPADTDQPVAVLGLSNDPEAAAPQRYILGLSPGDEVAAVVRYAIEQGRTRFASLVPLGRYGDQVQDAFGDTLLSLGGDLLAYERYPRIREEVFEPMKRLTDYDARRRTVTDEVAYLRSLGDDMTTELADKIEAENDLPAVAYDAVLVAEGGPLLRTIAPLFPFYEVDQPEVRLLGTGLMNDPALTDEIPLRGSWFAAPPKAPFEAFEAAYETRYGESPPRIASLAYDAVSLLAALARQFPDAEYLDPGDVFAADRLLAPTGFGGASGLFRLLPDGRVERLLSIYEIQADGLVEIEAAPSAFPLF